MTTFDLNREVFAQFDEVADSLYGAAVKVAHRYGFDLGDVVQEMAITAMDIEERYGFVHVTSVVQAVTSYMNKSVNYGTTKHYRDKGINTVSADLEDDEGNPWVDSFVDEVRDWDRIDTILSVRQEYDRLEKELDRDICRGLAYGLTTKEIGEVAGCHYSTVSTKKKPLRGHFEILFEDEAESWAV